MKKHLFKTVMFLIAAIILFPLLGCSPQPAATEFNSAEDLAEARIGVMTGSTGEQLANKHFPDADIKSFDEMMDAVTALLAGQVDAVLSGYPTVHIVTRYNPSVYYLDDAIAYEDTCVAVKQGNTELLDAINAVIAELRESGELELIVARWYKTDLSPYEPITMALPAEGEVLRIGVNATREPTSFLDAAGNFSGMDAEIAFNIAIALNRPVEIHDMNFSALIPALQSGKIDLIVTGMSATDERRQSVDFSEPYFANRQVLMLKKSDTTTSNLDTFSADGPSEAEDVKPGFLTSISEGFYRNIVHENRYLLIVDGLKTTALISILACIFGTLLGALVCFMRMSGNKILNTVARAFISVLRGIPALVLLMLIFYVVFASVNINPVFVAVVAFGMNFAAYVSEMFRSAILSIDSGQREAGIAGGFTGLQTFVYIIMPQAIRQVLPVYKGEFISMVKMTSIVGYIAVQDLTKAGDIIRSRTFDAFFPLIMVAVLYYLISWLLTLSLDYLAFKTDNRARRDRQAKRSNLTIQPTRKEEVTL
jgi:polar amino acid transport system substrate-binding protein